MRKLERVLLVILILSAALNLFLVALTDLLLLVSATLLSCLYFLGGILVFNKLSLRGVFRERQLSELSPTRLLASIALGITLSSTTLGFLFFWLGLEGGELIMVINLPALGILTLMSFIRQRNKPTADYSPFYLRALGFGIVAAVLLLLPDNAILNFKYRNYPAYLKAREAAEANPEDQALWEKVNAEAAKIGNPKLEIPQPADSTKAHTP